MKLSVRTLAALAALGGLAALTGGSSANASTWQGPGTRPSTQSSSALAITAPANGATAVPTATEITFTGAAPGAATVTLADATGAPVAGAMRPDGSAWVPA